MKGYLVLDIGNVCVHLDFDAMANGWGYQTKEELFSSSSAKLIEQYMAEYQSDDYQVQSFFDKILPLLPCQSLAEVEVGYRAVVGSQIAEISSIVKYAVNHDWCLIFLSDICDIHWKMVQKVIDFEDKIQHFVFSYEVGAVKPHKPMFEAVEKLRANLSLPVLYADDKPANIEAGLSFGWESFQIGSYEPLIHALEKYSQ